MIITKTPFRISFFGGGTDYPGWYEEHEGAVLSTTIDKYCYISARFLPPFFDHNYRVRYTIREETQTINEIQHPSVRECIRFSEIKSGIELQHNSDLPSGIGVGSSSSFTVGTLNALFGLKGQIVSKQNLAEDALYVEQKMIKENVGSQDQFAASFGGFNKILFTQDSIQVHPITTSNEMLKRLQSHLILFFTGQSRMASDIAQLQIEKTGQNKSQLHHIYSLVNTAINLLSSSNHNIEEFGSLLDETWKIKRGLTSKITNGSIDQIYETGIKSGALGGKLLGAGGGGCILFFIPPNYRNKIKSALNKLVHIPFKFEKNGSQVIYFSPS